MPYHFREDWASTAFAGGTVVTPDEVVAFTVHRLPDLLLPSGRVVASDPIAASRADAFTIHVNPGWFPVELAIGLFGTSDQRVGFARLRFGDANVHKWRMATTRDEDPSTLGLYGIFGYMVDSGTGCFASPEAWALLQARRMQARNDFEAVVAELDKTYRPTWAWADFVPEVGRPENLIAFSTGFGDGTYASYVGYDRNGAPVCLLTDFGCLMDPAAEPPE